MKKFDIIVMGELNVDLILSEIQGVAEIGTEIIAKKMSLTLGSSSAIFACNASSLGAKVAFVGKIGNDDFGNLVMSSLRAKNVNTHFITRSTDYVTGVTVALNYDQDRAMVTHPGAMEYLAGENISEELLGQAKHLHLSSIFLQPLVKRDLVQILKKAKRQGLTTSLDSQWDPAGAWDLDLESVLPLVDIFIPNEQEVLLLTGKEDLQSAIEHLQAWARLIVVKRGHKGSLAWSRELGKILEVPPFLNSQVVDAIGAGDSFDAGFVISYLRTKDIERCLRFGNLVGAISTTAPGGTAAFSSPERIQQTATGQFNVDIMSL